MDFSCGHSLYPREFSLVPEVKECTNAIFGIKVAIILDEPESALDVSDFYHHITEMTIGCRCFTLCKYC